MPAIDVNGVRLEYAEAGRGAPLVFIHGSLEDLRIWRRQFEPFSERFRVVTYSRRYHHPNAVPGDGEPAYTAALHADDLAGLIQELELGPAHLVTSSFGGCIALQMAGQHPELVRSLVLAEPPLMPWLAHIPGGAPLAAAFHADAWEPAQRAFRAGNSEQGVRLFLDGVVGRGAFDRLSPSGQRMILDNAPEMQAETVAQDFFPALTCREVATIDRPALLLNGELSPRLFHLIIDELARCLPQPVKALIPRTSHAIHVGNPGAYNAAVLEFLARQAPLASQERDLG